MTWRALSSSPYTPVLVWGTAFALLCIGWNDVRRVRCGKAAERLMRVRLLVRRWKVEPMKSKLKAPGTKRLKLNYDNMFTSFAFNSNLGRYLLAAMEGVGLAYREMGDDPAAVFRSADKNMSGDLDIEEFRAKLKTIDPRMDDMLIEQTFAVRPDQICRSFL